MAGVRELVDLTNVSEQIQSEENKKVSYEQVLLEDAEKWKVTLKRELINWGDYDIKANELSNKYIEDDFANLVKDKENEAYVKGIYYIKDGNLKDKTYIYDKVYDKVYKIPVTRIWKYKVHSVHELDYLQKGGRRNVGKVDYTSITQNAELKTINGLKYYEPDLNHLAKEVTSLIFYEKVNGNITTTEHPVSAGQWISSGRPNQIAENGHTYVLYDYANQIWANIRIETSSIQTNWTWIPRYEYSISGTTTNIAFVDTQDNKLNGEQGEFTKLKNFEGNNKKGMWVSKYEPTQKATTNASSYSYYIPDIRGLDKEATEVAIYNEDATGFVEYKKLSEIPNISQFSQNNNWFDYYNQRWANIKVTKNGLETWWVWIPRYGYKNLSQNSTDLIFINTADNPLDGTSFKDLVIPEVFKGNDKRGIWVSKYEPTSTQQTVLEDINNLPDVSTLITNTNKDKVKVYLELYNEDKTGFSGEVELSSIENLEQFTKVNSWYDYSEKAWANVKVINTQGDSDTSNDVETWWVWIPRYAYNMVGNKMDIVLLDKNNKTPNGKDMPKSYTIPEAFKDNQKEGIWVSKYEPTEKND